MSSNSGRAGHCERCGCANNNHLIQSCTAYDKRKKKACGNIWSRCTLSYHSQDAQYVDCKRCQLHPGAPPEGFWGTQPDDEYEVPTADDLKIPWPEPEAPSKKTSKKPKQSSTPSSSHVAASSSSQIQHGRSLSEESYDPLSADHYDLTGSLNQLSISNPANTSNTEHYVSTHVNKKDLVCFVHPETGQEIKTRQTSWEASTREYEGVETPCFVFNSKDHQRVFWTWQLG